jgi:hypothetical protein
MSRRTLSHRIPPALRSRGVRFDNLAVVPASLLPHKVSSQKYANTLPRGQVLIIGPQNASPARRAALGRVAPPWKGAVVGSGPCRGSASAPSPPARGTADVPVAIRRLQKGCGSRPTGVS